MLFLHEPKEEGRVRGVFRKEDRHAPIQRDAEEAALEGMRMHTDRKGLCGISFQDQSGNMFTRIFATIKTATQPADAPEVWRTWRNLLRNSRYSQTGDEAALECIVFLPFRHTMKNCLGPSR